MYCYAGMRTMDCGSLWYYTQVYDYDIILRESDIRIVMYPYSKCSISPGSGQNSLALPSRWGCLEYLWVITCSNIASAPLLHNNPLLRWSISRAEAYNQIPTPYSVLPPNISLNNVQQLSRSWDSGITIPCPFGDWWTRIGTCPKYIHPKSGSTLE